MERIWSIALTGSGAVGAVTGVFSLASAMLSLSHVDLTGGYDYLVCTVLTVFAFLLFACTAHSLDQIDQLNAGLREVRSL